MEILESVAQPFRGLELREQLGIAQIGFLERLLLGRAQLALQVALDDLPFADVLAVHDPRAVSSCPFVSARL